MNKTKLWDAINQYTETCGGDPSKNVQGNTSRQAAVVAVEQCLNPDPNIVEALEMLEGYITARSQELMKIQPPVFSGAEGNMLFKISQIKQYLGIKE